MNHLTSFSRYQRLLVVDTGRERGDKLPKLKQQARSHLLIAPDILDRQSNETLIASRPATISRALLHCLKSQYAHDDDMIRLLLRSHTFEAQSKHVHRVLLVRNRVPESCCGDQGSLVLGSPGRAPSRASAVVGQSGGRRQIKRRDKRRNQQKKNNTSRLVRNEQ